MGNIGNCSCSIISFGMPGIVTHSGKRRAFVERECVECNRKIHVGDVYEYTVGLVADILVQQVFKCRDCASVSTALFCLSATGRMWKDLRRHLKWTGKVPADECMAELTPTARAKVCDLIESIWEEEDAD